MAKICRKYVTGNGIRSKHKRKSAANNKEIMRIGIADDGFKLKAKLTLAQRCRLWSRRLCYPWVGYWRWLSWCCAAYASKLLKIKLTKE